MAKNLFARVTELWDEPQSEIVKQIDTITSTIESQRSTTQPTSDKVRSKLFYHKEETIFCYATYDNP